MFGPSPTSFIKRIRASEELPESGEELFEVTEVGVGSLVLSSGLEVTFSCSFFRINVVSGFFTATDTKPDLRSSASVRSDVRMHSEERTRSPCKRLEVRCKGIPEC